MQQHHYSLRMICCYENHRNHTTIDPRYVCKEGGLVVMHRRILCRIGILVVGPCRFLKHMKNSGLAAEVEDKTGNI